MAEWTLVTPYGTILCKKSRSYGEKVWREPETKSYGVRYFKGNTELQRDIYAYVNGKWIPSRGDNTHLKKIWYHDWVAQGKPKKIDGLEVGIVVKKVSADESKVVEGGKATILFDARKEVKISTYELKRFVSRDAKYIVPMPPSVALYRQVLATLAQKGDVLVTKPVQISSNSSVWYNYIIIPFNNALVMVEAYPQELEREFPPDALIKSDQPQEVGEIDEEDEELI